MPGRLWTAGTRPAGPAAAWSWRRDGRWRIWQPDGAGDAPEGQPADAPGEAAEPVQPSLQDAVTVAILARELGSDLASGPGPASGRDGASGREPARRDPGREEH
jgi:hypothetical protein